MTIAVSASVCANHNAPCNRRAATWRPAKHAGGAVLPRRRTRPLSRGIASAQYVAQAQAQPLMVPCWQQSMPCCNRLPAARNAGCQVAGMSADAEQRCTARLAHLQRGPAGRAPAAGLGASPAPPWTAAWARWARAPACCHAQRPPYEGASPWQRTRLSPRWPCSVAPGAAAARQSCSGFCAKPLSKTCAGQRVRRRQRLQRQRGRRGTEPARCCWSAVLRETLREHQRPRGCPAAGCCHWTEGQTGLLRRLPPSRRLPRGRPTGPARCQRSAFRTTARPRTRGGASW
jgi:hypothetical protein